MRFSLSQKRQRGPLSRSEATKVKPGALGGIAPALRNVREERGTHLVVTAGKIESLGHPPRDSLRGSSGNISP